MKADIDSIYSYNRSLVGLIETFKGPLGNDSDSMLMLKSKINPIKRAKGSRFFVDTTSLSDPPTVSGVSANKVGLERFASIELGTFSIGMHRPLTIYLVNLGVSCIYKETMFSKIEVAVVNASLNIARMLCKEDCLQDIENKIESPFLDFFSFKTCYGTSMDKAVPNEYNDIPFEDARLFCINFERALSIIAEGRTHRFDFTHQQYHGIKQSDGAYEADRQQMQNFALELKKGCVFMASLSGIKKFFNRSKFTITRSKSSPAFKQMLRDIVLENEVDLVEEANQLLLEEYGEDDEENLPDTDPPFVCSNEEGRTLDYTDINDRFPSFSRLFLDKWKEYIKEDFTNNLNELCDKLHNYFGRVFGLNPRDEDIFFDIGIEIRLKGTNSLLIQVDHAAPVMQTVANERYAY